MKDELMEGEGVVMVGGRVHRIRNHSVDCRLFGEIKGKIIAKLK